MEHLRQTCKAALGVIIPDCYLYRFKQSLNLREDLKNSLLPILIRYNLPLTLTYKTLFIYLSKLVNIKLNNKVIVEPNSTSEIVDNAISSSPMYSYEGKYVPDTCLGNRKFYITTTPVTKIGYINIMYDDLEYTEWIGVKKIIFGKVDKPFVIPYNQKIEYLFETCETFTEFARFAPMLKDPFSVTSNFVHNLDYYFFPQVPGLDLISGKLYLEQTCIFEKPCSDETTHSVRTSRMKDYEVKTLLSLDDARRAYYIGYIPQKPTIYVHQTEDVNYIRHQYDKFSINYTRR